MAHLLAVAVVGVLAGSGLAGLANGPGNDPCLASEDVREGTSFGSAVELWPLGVRCDYLVGTAAARSEFLGPTSPELYPWIAAAALLTALALWRRASAFVRGAASAAALLALAGVAWVYIGVNGAFFAAVCLGPPLAFALDRWLRPAGLRSRSASLSVAIALGGVLFCAIFAVVAIRPVGIAFGVLAGGLASSALERRWRRHAIPT
jgi:hypothetical protein